MNYFFGNNGYRVIDRNWRDRGGEVDIVAQCGSTLVFVEVKTRRSTRHGSPAEAVTARKLQHRRHRKVGRAHEDQPKRHERPSAKPVRAACYSAFSAFSDARVIGLPSFAAFSNFFRTRSRLSLEIWSMNSTPLRWSISC